MNKIYYIGLAVILVVLVAAAFFLARYLSPKTKELSAVQPTTQESQKDNQTEENKAKTSKKVVPKKASAKPSSRVPKTIQKVDHQRVIVEIPEGVQFTKTCNQKRCEILIYY